MTKFAINRSSFQATEGDEGTVEVTLGRETRRLNARRYGGEEGNIYVGAGQLGGRYATSNKVWNAVISNQVRSIGSAPKTECETYNFGRDDRSGRFNKLNCIFFV